MEEYVHLLAMNEVSDEEFENLLILEEEGYRKNIVVRSTRYPRLDLESLTNEECRSFFRFAKEDLEDLREVLKLPEKIRLEGRYSVSGVEGLCIYLRRLAYPNRLTDLEHLFGLSAPYLSCICKYVMNHINSTFGKLLIHLASNPWLNEEKLKEYSMAVSNKGAALQNCWGFIDGTARAICRPTENQQEYFSGHKRQHCLKYQSVLCPDGLIVNLQGPYPGRRHDAGILRESKLYCQLENTAVHDDRKYALYGDPAYPVSELILCPHSRRNPSHEEIAFNRAMSSVRNAVEWGFGKVAAEFAFIDFKKNQKLHLQELGKMYSTAVILSNCHTCLYGSQAGMYFNMKPPTIETYLSV